MKQSRENVKISEITCSEETALLRDSRLKYISSGNISEVLGRDSGTDIQEGCCSIEILHHFFKFALAGLQSDLSDCVARCSFSHPPFCILLSVLSVAAGHQGSQRAVRMEDQKRAVCSPSPDVSAWKPVTSLWNMPFFAVMGGDALRDEALDSSL